MIIAELSIFPTSEGASVSRYVREAIKALDESGLKHVTGGMSTALEAPDIGSLFRAVEGAYKAVASMGVTRIHIDLHVDSRLDKDATIASKLRSLKEKK